MVLEGHAPKVHWSKYSRRPGWRWLRFSMTQEPSWPHGRSKGPRLETEVWVVQLSLKKQQQQKKRPAPDYAEPSAFMRFDTCQVLGYFHMLIHFTLILTPGGWDISHMLWMGEKNELKKCSISFMARHPLHRKVENADPTSSSLSFLQTESPLRLDFWVPWSSPSPQIQLEVRLMKGVMFWKFMTMESTNEN